MRSADLATLRTLSDAAQAAIDELVDQAKSLLPPGTRLLAKPRPGDLRPVIVEVSSILLDGQIATRNARTVTVSDILEVLS